MLRCTRFRQNSEHLEQYRYPVTNIKRQLESAKLNLI